MIDYLMSEKFGLDWKKYDTIRMSTFISIMSYYAEKDKLEAEKAKRKNKVSGRGR